MKFESVWDLFEAAVNGHISESEWRREATLMAKDKRIKFVDGKVITHDSRGNRWILSFDGTVKH